MKHHALSGRQRNERVTGEADRYDVSHGLQCAERVYCRGQRAEQKEGAVYVVATAGTRRLSATAVNAADQFYLRRLFPMTDRCEHENDANRAREGGILFEERNGWAQGSPVLGKNGRSEVPRLLYRTFVPWEFIAQSPMVSTHPIDIIDRRVTRAFFVRRLAIVYFVSGISSFAFR